MKRKRRNIGGPQEAPFPFEMLLKELRVLVSRQLTIQDIKSLRLANRSVRKMLDEVCIIVFRSDEDHTDIEECPTMRGFEATEELSTRPITERLPSDLEHLWIRPKFNRWAEIGLSRFTNLSEFFLEIQDPDEMEDADVQSGPTTLAISQLPALENLRTLFLGSHQMSVLDIDLSGAKRLQNLVLYDWTLPKQTAKALPASLKCLVLRHTNLQDKECILHHLHALQRLRITDVDLERTNPDIHLELFPTSISVCCPSIYHY